jgi:predicted DCC family thiol-disulfide oxidoreductase YuxK
MNTNSKVMMYDDNCPLCNAYTNAFVKMGLLDVAGRQPLSQVDKAIISRLDKHKSRNEIPLLDTATNQAWYGLDAMLEVISGKYPFVKKVANIAFVKWFLFRLYKLISYNRKVIVAVPKSNSPFNCTPDFNKKYRLAFLLLVTVACVAFISPAYQFFSVKFSMNINLQQAYLGFTVLWLTLFMIPKLVNSSMAFHYWGQLAMLCLLSVLLTLPLIVIGNIVAISTLIKGLYFFCMFTFLLKEVLRRKVYLKSILEYSKRPLSQLK